MTKTLKGDFHQNETLTPQAPQFTHISFDPKRFEKHLDDPSMSDQQKEEFLLVIYQIALGFIDLGLGIHPIQ